MKFKIQQGGKAWWTTTIEVQDEPISSSADALRRQADLRTLSEELKRVEKFKTRVFGPDRKLSRLSEAVETLQKHLAVWQVQNQ